MPNQREKIKEKIIKKVYEILEKEQNGIRYADLIRKISKELPDTKINTIHGTVWEFKQKIDRGEVKDVLRPEKGWYILKKYFGKTFVEKTTSFSLSIQKPREEDFYKPFADYLVNELEECTKAIPLGSNKFQDRWGTPDVIGTYKVLGLGHIQPPIEIITAEIKIDTRQLITAFGQACSYKLFSHKVYLVIPKDANGTDIKRVESLCLKFGIGLILFNRHNKENPEFEILTRAVKSEPDYFYLNKYLRLIENEARDLF
jgi:hypothetical protein